MAAQVTVKLTFDLDELRIITRDIQQRAGVPDTWPLRVPTEEELAAFVDAAVRDKLTSMT
jgi:hypothetical protein